MERVFDDGRWPTAVALDAGWRIPAWYTELKATAVPLLGCATAMADGAPGGGLIGARTQERPVDVGVTHPGQAVRYCLGQAIFASWLDQVCTARGERLARRAAEAIRPIMRPYRPVVVFLAARVPYTEPFQG